MADALRQVWNKIRNSQDSEPPTNAPAAEPPKPSSGMTCPQCGCALDLQAVAAKSGADNDADDAMPPQASAQGDGAGV